MVAMGEKEEQSSAGLCLVYERWVIWRVFGGSLARSEALEGEGNGRGDGARQRWWRSP